VNGYKKLKAIRKLKENEIPVSVMLSPVIPGLNDHEIPLVIRESADHGADDINMTLIRLNGAIGIIFQDWLKKHYPDKEKKIINQIKSLHNGKLNESRFGFRMHGEGPIAQSIYQLFRTIKSHYFRNNNSIKLETSRFRRHSMQNLFHDEI
jgi:DNA repair photolyase